MMLEKILSRLGVGRRKKKDKRITRSSVESYTGSSDKDVQPGYSGNNQPSLDSMLTSDQIKHRRQRHEKNHAILERKVGEKIWKEHNDFIYSNVQELAGSGIDMTKKAYQKLEHIVDVFSELQERAGFNHKREMSFHLVTDKDYSKEGKVLIDDVHIPRDQISRLTTTLFNNGSYFDIEPDLDNKTGAGWAHSHAYFNTFFSDTDVNTFNTLIEGSNLGNRKKIKLSHHGHEHEYKLDYVNGIVVNARHDEPYSTMQIKFPQYEVDDKGNSRITYKQERFSDVGINIIGDEQYVPDKSEDEKIKNQLKSRIYIDEQITGNRLGDYFEEPYFDSKLDRRKKNDVRSKKIMEKIKSSKDRKSEKSSENSGSKNKNISYPRKQEESIDDIVKNKDNLTKVDQKNKTAVDDKKYKTSYVRKKDVDKSKDRKDDIYKDVLDELRGVRKELVDLKQKYDDLNTNYESLVNQYDSLNDTFRDFKEYRQELIFNKAGSPYTQEIRDYYRSRLDSEDNQDFVLGTISKIISGDYRTDMGDVRRGDISEKTDGRRIWTWDERMQTAIQFYFQNKSDIDSADTGEILDIIDKNKYLKQNYANHFDNLVSMFS